MQSDIIVPWIHITLPDGKFAEFNTIGVHLRSVSPDFLQIIKCFTKFWYI